MIVVQRTSNQSTDVKHEIGKPTAKKNRLIGLHDFRRSEADQKQ